MSKARIKVRNLPSAPNPTRPTQNKDPRETEREQRIKEHRQMYLRIDQGKKLCFWDRARVSKLQRLYNDGHTVEYIAREVGCSKEVCRNRLNYEYRRGALKPRSRLAKPEQVETIIARYKAGESLNMISKELRMSRYGVRKVLTDNNMEIKK